MFPFREILNFTVLALTLSCRRHMWSRFCSDMPPSMAFHADLARGFYDLMTRQRTPSWQKSKIEFPEPRSRFDASFCSEQMAQTVAWFGSWDYP